MGTSKLQFNPLVPPFDNVVDLAGNFDWTGAHSWGTSAGAAGFANFYADEAGKGLIWDGDATPGNPVFKLVGKSNTDQHFVIDVDLTSKPTGGGFFSPIIVDADASYTGGGMIMVAQSFTVTDRRTVNAAGLDFLRAFSMLVTRTAGYSTALTQNAGIEGIFLDVRDAGTYSAGGGAGWAMVGMHHEYTLTPAVALTGAKSYPFSVLKVVSFSGTPSGTGLANLTLDADLLDLGAGNIFCSNLGFGWGKIDLTGVKFAWQANNIVGGQLDVQFIDYAPTITNPTTHHFAKIMSGRTWIGADGADTTTTWDGQLCFGAGTAGVPDSAIYDDGTYLAIATNFAASGGTRGLHFVDQTYTAGAPAATGYVTIRVAGTNYKFLVAT